MRNILRFYALDTKDRSKSESQRLLADTGCEDVTPGVLDAERRVEDAGLYEDMPKPSRRLVAWAS